MVVGTLGVGGVESVGEMCWLGYKVYFTSALTTMSLFAP